MNLIDVFLSAHFVPFTLALGLLCGLFLLELTMALLGNTLLGIGNDPEVDIDVELGAPEIDVDLGELELDINLGDFDIAPRAEPTPDLSAPAGALAWLGLGKIPTVIWLASMLLSFGAGG
ncbi:MAG: hypothetical protein AAF330_03025, partial [Pseudomonadota bacterium]